MMNTTLVLLYPIVDLHLHIDPDSHSFAWRVPALRNKISLGWLGEGGAGKGSGYDKRKHFYMQHGRRSLGSRVTRRAQVQDLGWCFNFVVSLVPCSLHLMVCHYLVSKKTVGKSWCTKLVHQLVY